MYKLLMIFLLLTISYAAEDSYTFEVKGQFAKDLKALVEKYSKEGKIEAKIYNNKNFEKTKTKTITQRLLSTFSKNDADELKNADLSKGKTLYTNNCAKCHGLNADDNSYGNSRKLATLKPIEIIDALDGYRENYDGKFGGSLRYIMKPQADNLTSVEMQSLAVYIYSIKNHTNIKKVNDTQEMNNDAQSSYLQ